MKPITVIGGGLAGLTLGILLRRENIPVAIIEAGRYPRHRVCGEFLSGRGRRIFQALGLEEKLPQKVEASSCGFYLRDQKPICFKLREPALCASRYDLDHLLACEFERLGGVLKSGERANTEFTEEGIVRATGRRRSENATGYLIGVKAHILNASPTSDLEMHFGQDQYVGICRLANSRANVCGLFYSSEPIRALHENWKSVFKSSIWSNALSGGAWDEDSFSSVAGITLDRDAPPVQFTVGDAAAMIPPLTGNGMSMAFESAETAFRHLVRYSKGEISWAESLRAHFAEWQHRFSSRLRWADFVQRMIFSSSGQRTLYVGSRLIPRLPNLFFARTR